MYKTGQVKSQAIYSLPGRQDVKVESKSARMQRGLKVRRYVVLLQFLFTGSIGNKAGELSYEEMDNSVI